MSVVKIFKTSSVSMSIRVAVVSNTEQALKKKLTSVSTQILYIDCIFMPAL